jgi:hypothetical protein
MSQTKKYDAFISHSSADKAIADAACSVLERSKVRCWVAPRDIAPGREWGEEIIKGIDSSKVLLLIFSSHANESAQVRREVERAIGKGLPVLPFRIEDVVPAGAMEFALSNTHWLDGFTPPMANHLEQLARSIKSLIDQPTTVPEKHSDPTPPSVVSSPAAKSWKWILGVASASVLLAILAFFLMPGTTPQKLYPGQAAAKSTNAEFVPLFNGKDLTGWEKLGNEKATWNVVNKALVGTMPGNEVGGVLKTTRSDYKNFHLRLTTMKSEFNETRIHLYSLPSGVREGASRYRISLGSPKNEFGKEFGRLSLLKNEAKKMRKGLPKIEDKKWYTLDVISEGDRVTVDVDGVRFADFADKEKPWRRGTDIRLVLWGSTARFQKIEIKELP